MSLAADAFQPGSRWCLEKLHRPPGSAASKFGFAPKTLRALWVMVLVLAAGCGVSPEDPGPGELTAVLVPQADHPMIDFGSKPSSAHTHVLILTEADILEAFENTWPGRELPREFEYSYVGVDVPLAELQQVEDGGEPVDAPAMGAVNEGRVRLPWSGEPRYLCFGSLNNREEVHTAGCVLVDKDPPVAVTVEIHHGGMSLDD